MDYLIDYQHGYTYKVFYYKLNKPKNDKISKEEILSNINFSQSCLSKGKEDSNESQKIQMMIQMKNNMMIQMRMIWITS